MLANARACEIEHSQRSWWSISWSQNQKQTSLNDGIPCGGGVVNSANMMEMWKYFSVIFNCFQLESPRSSEWVQLKFFDILFQDKVVKGLSDFFLTAVDELGLDISTCGGEGYDNGADTKTKSEQTQILCINLELSLLHVTAIT